MLEKDTNNRYMKGIHIMGVHYQINGRLYIPTFKDEIKKITENKNLL